MARNYKHSDYAKNKYSSNIVYAGSNENVEITLEQFLRENPEMTEEDFKYWKDWSDEDYCITDRKDSIEAKHTVSIHSIEATELVSVPSAEDIVIEKLSHENERIYTMQDAEMVLSKLTDIQRRRYLLHAFREMEIPCFEPFGAFYVFPCIKEFGMTSEEFATRFLQEEKVAVVPGTAFGDCGEGFLRISYAYSIEDLKEALGRMERFISRLRGEK